jgi:hypothetical protein
MQDASTGIRQTSKCEAIYTVCYEREYMGCLAQISPKFYLLKTTNNTGPTVRVQSDVSSYYFFFLTVTGGEALPT